MPEIEPESVPADIILAEVTRGAYKLAVQILKQPEDAEDVLQEAAAVAASHANAPRPENENYRSWFFKVVRNKAIDRLRQINRQKLEALDESTLQSAMQQEPAARLEQHRLEQRVKIALDCLPVTQREIVLLRDYHGFAYGEIAEILNIPTGSVMSRLHRSRLALRELLGATETSGVREEKVERVQ